MSKTLVRTILALSTVLLLGLVMAMPLASAAAEAPEWNEGDGWAMGKSVDLDAEFAEELMDLQQTLGDQMGSAANAEVDQFDVQATASAYVLLKVTDVTDAEVVLEGKVAGKITAEASISISADLDAPGTYDFGEVAPKERRTIAVDIDVDIAAVLEVEVVLQKSDSSVKSIEVGIEASAAIDASVTNFPNIEFNWSAFERTVTYTNYHVELDFNSFVTVKAEFVPALDMYNFPLEVGDEWIVDSQATITGTYGGSLDIKGLPEEMEDSLFEMEFLQDAGINSFPVDFAQVIENDEAPYAHDGVIGPETVDMEAVTMQCVSADSIMINDWAATKYTIWVDEGVSVYCYFDSDENFLQNMNQVMKNMFEEELDIPEEIPIGDPALEMEDVSLSEAEQEIADISDYRAQIAGESTSDGDTLGGLDLMMILLLVGAIAVVLVILVVLLKKKPKVP